MSETVQKMLGIVIVVLTILYLVWGKLVGKVDGIADKIMNYVG